MLRLRLANLRSRKNGRMNPSFTLGRIAGIRIGVNYVVYAMTH